jgi:hypothetical protein
MKYSCLSPKERKMKMEGARSRFRTNIIGATWMRKWMKKGRERLLIPLPSRGCGGETPIK